MFSRRRANAPIKPVDPSTYAAAATAATSAFLQKSQSNASLSSAAAAAALRSHTTSPEPVGNIQTKRMVRRGSVSSNGSGSVVQGGSERPGLRRANSSGSMTERTFRQASPTPRTMSLNMASPSASKAVPAVRHQRSSSLEGPQRIVSPTPAEGQRGVSADTAGAAQAPPGTSRHAKRLSNVVESEEPEKAVAGPSGRLPRSAESEEEGPVITGAAKKYTHGTGSWFTQSAVSESPTMRPTTSDGVPTYRPPDPQPNLGLVATKPVKKNRIPSAPGSHLAQANKDAERNYGIQPGTPYALPSTEYDPNTRRFVYKAGVQRGESQQPQAESNFEKVYDPNTRTFINKPRSQLPSRSVSAASASTTPSRLSSITSQGKRPVRPAVDTSPQPPPRNPARLSPGNSSPVSPRLLHKQPSLVREDPDAEREAEAEATATPSSSGIQSSPATHVAPDPVAPRAKAHQQRSSSLDVPSVGLDAGRGRVASHSPLRSAHFSPSPILKPERHVPPARATSPAKSAMKQSPASSVRTASPMMTFSPTSAAGPSSETSETPSLGSHDGLGVSKKKSARVSFDEQLHEIAAPAGQPSPSIRRDRSPALDDYDDDGLMQPRPALPSFGSVRRDRVQADPAQKVTEMPPERHETSSDHAIGGILKSSLEPIPPEVTSKESAGYASDESSEAEVPAVNVTRANSDLAGKRADEAASGKPQVRDFAQSSQPGEGSENGDVPAINLLPPTPGVDNENEEKFASQQGDTANKIQDNRNSMEGIVVPGGWKQDDEAGQTEAKANKSELQPSTEESSTTPATSPLQLTQSPMQMSDIDEESDDNAEFSDALEEPSEYEDEGGFASMDAIVESPMRPVPAPLETRLEVPEAEGDAESPSDRNAVRQVGDDGKVEAPEQAEPKDWDATTSYWSRLSKEKRAQIEREHLSSDDEVKPPPPRKPKVKQPQPVEVPKTPVQPENQKSLGTRTSLRTSMRGQPQPTPVGEGTHMRRTMRSGPGGAPASTLTKRPQSEYVQPRPASPRQDYRPSSASGLSAGAATRAVRPTSPTVEKSQESAYPLLPTTKTTLRKARPEPPQVSARLQKEITNDSDSESSFKKRRRGNSASKTDQPGKYTMKRSMRGASIDDTSAGAGRPSSPDPVGRGKGFSRFRSLSPPNGSIFNRSKDNASNTSLEGGLKTTLRGPPAAKSVRPTVTTPTPASRFKSRFVDSDDEDEADVPKRFRSRFADSDEEDEPASPPAGLPPVRGIPRRQGQEDGDSTDLEDERDDDQRGKTSRKLGKSRKEMATDPNEVDKAMAAARRNLGMPDSPPAVNHQEGSALQKGSLRTKPAEESVPPIPDAQDVSFAAPEKKKKGFMSGFLRRNRNSSTSVPQVGQSSPAQAPASPAVASPGPTAKQEVPPSPSSPIGKLVRRNSSQVKLQSPAPPAAPATNTTTTTNVPKVSEQELNSWPRPTEDIVKQNTLLNSARPESSQGFSPEAVRLARTMRPDIGPRSASGQPLGNRVTILAGEEGSEPGERPAAPNAIYSQRTGRKKKFGTLRRVFGLND